MGKGGGCVPSKQKRANKNATSNKSGNSPIQIDVSTTQNSSSLHTSTMPSAKPMPNLIVFIIFYSKYNHVEVLARKMKEGFDGIDGVEGILYRVLETHSDEVLRQMKAPEKDDSIPVISVEEIEEADGILFGFPTRYGAIATQMKAFFDSTGQLWKEQKLAGKPTGFLLVLELKEEDKKLQPQTHYPKHM